MKKVIGLSVVTVICLGFSSCASKDNIVKPQCIVYTLQNNAKDFCKNKNLQLNPRLKYSSEAKNILAFECITKKEVHDKVDKVDKVKK
jgi:hypothetical protein